MEASNNDKKLVDSTNIDAKFSEFLRKNSLVNGISEDNNTVTVTASLRQYHEKYATPNDIPNPQGSIQEGKDSVEESEEDTDEEEEADKDDDPEKEAEASPKVADFNFDVS